MTIVDRQFPFKSRKVGRKSTCNSAILASRWRRRPCPIASRIGGNLGADWEKHRTRLSIDNRRPSDGDRTVFGG